MNSSSSSPTKVALAGFIGTAIEWYDFFIYGTASALVFNRLFFPQLSPFAGTLASLSTFAVGFFARPLGGIVFGHFGDRFGRKSMLVISLLMMGLTTLFIGLLPTYDQIGASAAVLLVLLRFIQGFGVGGEWGGAVLLAVEHADPGKRGWYASWIQVGVPAGLLLGNGVFSAVSILPEPLFLSWGWRIPFFMGGLLMGVGLFIRMRILESPLFLEVKKESSDRFPIVDVLRNQFRFVLLAMGARMAENVAFYLFTVFILAYLKLLSLPDSVGLQGVLFASAFQMITIPFFGRLSDIWGRRNVYLFGAIGMSLFAWLFFWMVDTRETIWIWLGLVIGLSIFHASMYGPQGAFFAEMFPTKVRYSGASLGYQLASPLAGGLAPLIAAHVLNWSENNSFWIAGYLFLMCLVTIISVYLARETSLKELKE